MLGSSETALFMSAYGNMCHASKYIEKICDNQRRPRLLSHLVEHAGFLAVLLFCNFLRLCIIGLRCSDIYLDYLSTLFQLCELCSVE
jgi:hypothetical protein